MDIFAEAQKLTEAYCVDRGIPAKRHFTDAALSAAIKQIRAASTLCLHPSYMCIPELNAAGEHVLVCPCGHVRVCPPGLDLWVWNHLYSERLARDIRRQRAAKIAREAGRPCDFYRNETCVCTTQCVRVPAA